MEPSAAEPLSTSTSDSTSSNVTQRRTASTSSSQPQGTKSSEKPTPKPTVTDLSDDDEQESNAQAFECNICLDVAKEPVVSHCGHLFCWPCLHQWLETRPNRQSCPVCKAVVSRDKVIPLYGRGGSQEDPRSKVPPRPTPTRQEQPEGNRFTWGNNDGGAGGFHLSFGIGAFPFGFFASALNLGQAGPFGQQAGGMQQNVQLEEQEFLSKVFLYVAVVFIIWLFLA